MIPTEEHALALWDKYGLPEEKRVHVALVATVALFLAEKLQQSDPGIHIHVPLLRVTALLHDIDKSVQRLPGEQHPDTGVRILREEGMEEVAEVVRTHAVHTILDPAIAPKTLEEKLLYLADKMVKFEVITVDKRFALWKAEHLPVKEQATLDACYPKVKMLEREIFGKIAVNPGDVASFV